MCAFATPLRGWSLSCSGAARWLICAVALGFAVAVTAPEPAESRPRSSKSRISKSGEKESSSRRRSRRQVKPEPAPVPLAVQPPPEEIPELPTRRNAPPAPDWPRAATPLGPEPPPDVWPEAEIKEALAQCRQRLGDVRFEFKQLEPLKKGVCGNPAPIQLKFINDTPRVEVRPAATISCPLADAIDRWLTEVVQPRAKDLLDATVIRVVNLSGYDCRMRNGTPTQRMSYHAWAEALDIAEFVTAKGEHINVLEHWNAGDERAQFLRDIHDGGCKIFGTVLGPEANEAHRNHFHVDMAKRRRSAYCQ
jgi:hypothetical protein